MIKTLDGKTPQIDPTAFVSETAYLIGDVEVGIQKVYGLEALGKHFVFNTCLNYLDEKRTYSRELNDSYQPTDKIERKEWFHLMDAERYITGNLRTASVGGSKAPRWFRW